MCFNLNNFITLQFKPKIEKLVLLFFSNQHLNTSNINSSSQQDNKMCQRHQQKETTTVCAKIGAKILFAFLVSIEAFVFKSNSKEKKYFYQ